MSFWTKLFGDETPAKQPAEDRSQWSKAQYAQALAAKFRAVPDATGLEQQRTYLRVLGQEIYEKFGFSWTQEIWNALMKEFGPPHCHALLGIWDGIVTWRPHTDADALAAELIFIGKHNEFTVMKDDGSGRYDENNRHKRAREIGELLDQDAGIEMMRYAHNQVRAAGCDATDLELCWNGVGQWRR
jgi:hypothetical protein